MLTIDARCGCSKCEERTKNIYRMVGSCSNCGTGDIFILYRAGDAKADQDCPVCERFHSVRVYSQRIATTEEIPAATPPAKPTRAALPPPSSALAAARERREP